MQVLCRQEVVRRDKRNCKFDLRSRQSVQASPLSHMCFSGSSSRGNQAFPLAEGPGLLPDICTPSPACHCFLLQRLRAVGRNRPIWLGAGYPALVHCLPLHPQPHHRGLHPISAPQPRADLPAIHMPSGRTRLSPLPSTAGTKYPPAAKLRVRQRGG